MSRTYRTYHPGMCLRGQANRPHKVERSVLADIVAEYGISLGNRALFHATPEPWDDKPIAALAEIKYRWR